LDLAYRQQRVPKNQGKKTAPRTPELQLGRQERGKREARKELSREASREASTEANRETSREASTEASREANRESSREGQAERQAQRQAERQAQRQTLPSPSCTQAHTPAADDYLYSRTRSEIY
jgi:epidermal growth factor receptor substrate 15